MWKFVLTVLRVLVAAWLVLVVGTLALILTLCDSGWRNSLDVWVRNRTSAPLQLTVTVSRSTLKTDTVWWGVAGGDWGAERAVGYAVRLTALSAEGLQYRSPFPLPVLVRGTADTLESIDTRPVDVQRYAPHRWDSELWLTRQQQAPPPAADFARGIGLRALPDAPDSVRLTFSLAPDSSFLVARHSQRLKRSDPDRFVGEELLLRPTVRWVNSSGPHTERVPSAAALRRLVVAAQQERSNDYQLTHYLNYR